MSKPLVQIAAIIGAVTVLAGCGGKVPVQVPSLPVPTTETPTTTPTTIPVNTIVINGKKILPRHMSVTECSTVDVRNDNDFPVTLQDVLRGQDNPRSKVNFVVPPKKTMTLTVPTSTGMILAAKYVNPDTGEVEWTYPSVDFMVESHLPYNCNQNGRER